VVSILVVVVSLSVTVLLVLGFNLGVRGFILGQTAGTVVGFLASLGFSWRRYRHSFSWKLLRAMLNFSLPLVPSSLLVLTWTYVDRLFISNYLTIGDLGIYGIGVRFASVASMIVLSINLALTPLIYANYRKQETPARISQLASLFFLTMCLLLAGASLFSKEILVIMTTEQFYGAAGVIPFLMAGALLSQMYDFAPGVFIAKKTHLILFTNVLACFLSVGLNFLLVPRLGILGAAISKAVNGFFVFSMYACLGQREYRIPYRLRDILVAVGTVIVAYILARIVFSDSGGSLGMILLLKAVVFMLLCIVPALRIVSLLRGTSGLQATMSH
jgi:O-antigen/teichoic acid export membrane protein